MSAIVKRSVVIAGHRTSISLEEPFWRLLKRRAEAEGVSVPALIGAIDNERRTANLSSAIRVALLDWVMTSGEIVLNAPRSDDAGLLPIIADASDQR